MKLDRFAYGKRDRQTIGALTRCEGCEKEIYPGEMVYVIDGRILHADKQCLWEYLYLDIDVMTVDDAMGVRR